MRLSSFYESRWKQISTRYEDNPDKLNYMRTEYEFWAQWIERFYSGEYGIYNTVSGDAPRYAIEYDLDFLLFEKDYEKNFEKKDHETNLRVRAEYIIKRLKRLFDDVDKYIICSSEDENGDENDNFNLNYDEMKTKMLTDNTYKQKWFEAAYDANYYYHYFDDSI